MTLRDDAIAELSAWRTDEPTQETLRSEFLDLVRSREDALARTCAPAHLTASALVLDPARELALLVLHRKVRRWLQVGGHCEPGDRTLADAAWREATEESGIEGLRVVPGVLDLDRHPAPCRPGVVEHHLDVRYLLLAEPGAEPTVSPESLDVRWFRWDVLPAGVEPTILRMVAAGRRRLTTAGDSTCTLSLG